MPTQKDVAKLAGVASGTVSNVIRGGIGVSDRVRRKVLEAIRVLNYRPNLIARSLKMNRTHTLGIVVPDITIPFFPKLIRGAESAAQERNYFLIVLDSGSNHEREVEMLALLWAQRVEGILLVAAEGQKWSAEDSTPLTAGSPVVCVDRLPRGLAVDSVCVDDCSGAEMGVSHLLEMGHRDIAVISGPASLKNEQERLRGYRQALQKRRVPVRESMIWSASFNPAEIAAVCQSHFFKPGGRPSAIFSTNGVTGLAALKSLYAAGLSTPEDFSFVTFDELTSEELFRPGITSVVQPAFDIGSRAVEVLLRRIKKGMEAGGFEKIRLPATLTVRESSRSPYRGMARIR